MRQGEWIGGAQVVGMAGKGAMGVVYRAQQPSLDRTVAVKVVAGELAADPEFRARFQREARAAGGLSHPHIVTVHAAGEDQGRLYLTMQFVEGDDLASMLRRHGPMPVADAVEVVGQIASALDAAHERRLIHRDVKPANIMVTRRGTGWHAYLTDFGITTRVGEAGLTRAGLAIGTLDYMAPEQLVGDPYDHRADVYALGAVLFETLTGRVPFPRATDAARIYAHLNSPVPNVVTEMKQPAQPQVSSALAVVIQRAMAKQASVRFASAGELARAAKAAVEGSGSTRAPRDQAYQPVHEENSRNPKRRAVLLAGTGGLLVAGTGAIYAVPRLREPSPKKGAPASPTLGLPKGTPAATPSTTYRGLTDKPFFLDAWKDYIWVNNRGGTTMSRFDQSGGEPRTVDVGISPHDFVIQDSGDVWFGAGSENGAFVQQIDGRSAELKGKPIPTGQGSLNWLTGRGRYVWVCEGNLLVQVDLEERRVGHRRRFGRNLVGSPADPEVLAVFDRDTATLYRLDMATGEDVGPPQRVPDGFNTVSGGNLQGYVGAPEIGWGPLGHTGFPAEKDLRLKGFDLYGESAGLRWARNMQTSELVRVRPDLSGVMGAPVEGLVTTDETRVAGTGRSLFTMVPTERTIRAFTIAPLRRL